MKIYTSYFAKATQLKQNNIVPICISLGVPRFFSGDKVEEFAPTRAILNQTKVHGDTKEYTKQFKEHLEKIDVEKMRERLKLISDMYGGADIALCCYEKVTDFCHRHIVAEWLRDKMGVEVTEFGSSTHYEGLMMVQKSFWN